jgi:sensor histidine kinase YesM
LYQACGWGAFALINSFFAYSFDKLNTREDRIFFLVRLGIFVMLGLVFTHLMRSLLIRLNTLQKSLDKQVLNFFIITFIFATAASFFDIELLTRFSETKYSGFVSLLNDNEKKLLENPGKSYFTNKILVILSGAFYFFVYFFIWNLIYFVYHYVSKSRKQQLDTLQLESLVKELELKTIKAHINPHFIFNSLNSIRALVVENPERARKAITELSNILRSSMKVEQVETVAFEKELDSVKDYLALENMRFEDRLRIEYQIDEDTLNQLVPPMMLQTLVENAIKHGISKQVNGGVVKVISDFKDDYHQLAVQNTGFLNGGLNHEGFGLSSTTNRLNLIYGDKARFEIKQNGTLVEARVLLPVSPH